MKRRQTEGPKRKGERATDREIGKEDQKTYKSRREIRRRGKRDKNEGEISTE